MTRHICISQLIEGVRVSKNNNNNGSCKQQHARLVSLLCKQCQNSWEFFFGSMRSRSAPLHSQVHIEIVVVAQSALFVNCTSKRSCCCLRCAFALLWSTTAMMDFEMQQQHTYTSTRESAHTQWQLVHKLSAFLHSLIMRERERECKRRC